MKTVLSALSIAAIVLSTSAIAHAGQFAGAVVSYDSGATPATQWPSNDPYNNASAALGMPDDVTGEEGAFGTSLLSPFSAADELAEIVSIGEGGHLEFEFAASGNLTGFAFLVGFPFGFAGELYVHLAAERFLCAVGKQAKTSSISSSVRL